MTLGARFLVADDRERLRAWRNSDRVRSVSGSDRVIGADEHAAWFARQVGDTRLLVVTWDERPVGVAQLEGVDVEARTAGWGCYLGEIDVPPGVGAIMPLIGLGLGFGVHDLVEMHAEVLATNTNMLKMHRRLAVPRTGTRAGGATREDGTAVDVAEFSVTPADWSEIRDRGAAMVPRQVRDGLNGLLDRLDAGAP